MKGPEFDVAVVGAGLVGSAAAAALAREGFRVALLEAQSAKTPDPTADVDLRVSALSRASQRLLERLGAWQTLPASRCCAYERMVVWDAAAEGSGGGEVTFEAAEIGEPDLGHIVENRALQHGLWQAALAAGVEVHAPASVKALEVADRVATLTLADGAHPKAGLTAKLVVAADGADSKLRAMAGFAVDAADYDEHAVVAHLRPARSHQATAWQRFQPGGPLAMLPLADGRVSIVWTTTPAHAAELLALEPAMFGSAVSEASAGRLGALALESGRAKFPLRRLHALEYCAPRLALIGDAAHVVHPLAGQGVNLGFADVEALTETLVKAREKGDDPGELPVLRAYERWRHAENEAMVRLMDGFDRLFGDESGVVARVRELGLALFGRSGPIKRQVMRRSVGLANDHHG